MATGDYHLTALAVARGVGMVPPQKQVIVIQAEAETRPAAFASKASALKAAQSPKSPTGKAARQMSRAVSFAEDLVRSKEREHQGLVFHVDNGSVASQALIAIAQVSQTPLYTTLSKLDTTVQLKRGTVPCHVICSMLQCAHAQLPMCATFGSTS